MNEVIEINEKEMKFLITNLLVTKVLFTFPRGLFRNSGNAAWIQVLYMGLIAWLVLEVSFRLYRFSGNRSVIQLAECVGKKPLKIAVCLIILAVIGVYITTGMRAFSESVKMILLPKTEIEYILLLFIAAASIGAFCGISALALINAMFFLFFTAAVAILVIALVPYFKLNNIFPVFGTGAKQIFISGLNDLSIFSDILVLNLLMPYCKDMNVIKKGGRNAIFLATAISAALVLAYGLCYPYPASKEYLMAAYQLSRMVKAGEYFQRFEAFFEFVWSLTQLLYMSIYIWVICDVIKNSFGLTNSKRLIPCVTAAAGWIAFCTGSIGEMLKISNTLRRCTYPIPYLLPVIMSLLYMAVRRRKPE